MAGGNVQFARVVVDSAKVNAVRAMPILKRQDASNDIRAAAYALAEAGDADSVTCIPRDVVARDFDGEELRNSTARALISLANRRVPVLDDLVGQLERWLDAPLPEDVGCESPPVIQPADRGDTDGPASARGDEERARCLRDLEALSGGNDGFVDDGIALLDFA